MECASARVGDSLELFPRRVPLERCRATRCRLPEEFVVTPTLRRFAEAAGLDADAEFRAFRDHFRGSGVCKADWPATFRTWIRRSHAEEERETARTRLLERRWRRP